MSPSPHEAPPARSDTASCVTGANAEGPDNVPGPIAIDNFSEVCKPECRAHGDQQIEFSSRTPTVNLTMTCPISPPYHRAFWSMSMKMVGGIAAAAQ